MGENSSSNGFHIDEDGEISLYKKDATSIVSFKIGVYLFNSKFLLPKL